MPPTFKIVLTWLRSNLSWSNSWQSWQERLSLVGLFGAAVALIWFRGEMTAAQLTVLWGVWVLLLAILMRRGWLKLFGPVLFYDLVRTARRTRDVILRCIYAGFLMMVLFWIYATWMADRSNSLWDFLVGGSMGAHDMVNFAESFFYTFMTIQLVVVALLTPAYTAGAIAEEKDRKTMEFLLATDLRNREIVLSKLFSRLINLTLIVLTGLPILSLMQFLGGVDPDLVLACFVATGVSIFSLASFSILNSVLFRKPLHAIVFTYLGMLAYLAVSGMSWIVLILPGLTGLAVFPSQFWASAPFTVQDVVELANSGNIIAVVISLVAQVGMGGRLDATLPDALRNHVLFHVLLALGCILWSVARVRQTALKQRFGTPAVRIDYNVRLIGRPRVGSFPMLWKEIFAEPGLGNSWLVRFVALVLVGVSFVPLAAIFIAVIYAWMNGWFTGGRDWEETTQIIGAIHVRFVGTVVGCLLLLAIGVRAAGSISGERDRQTLDGLLTSPISSDSILFSKWLGSLLSVRWGMVWLGAIWGIGVITGGMHFAALPLVAGAWLVFACFMAVLGLWFSMTCRTSLRAIVWTLLTTVVLCFAHFFVLTCPMTILIIAIDEREVTDIAGWIYMFEVFSMTPPATLGFLAFHGSEFKYSDWEPMEAWPILLCSLIGVFGWGVLAILLGGAASYQFRKLTGRLAVRSPEQAPPAERPRRSAPAAAPAPAAETRIQSPDAGAWIKDGEAWTLESVEPMADGDGHAAKPAAPVPEVQPIDHDGAPPGDGHARPAPG